MTRLLAIITLALLLMGCRAPTPSMNVFAPYGSATVPAPATGTIGTAGGYYAPQLPPTAAPNQPIPNQPIPNQPSASPPTTPGYGLSAPATAGTTLLGMSGEPTPAAGSYAVAQASFQPGSTAGDSPSTLRIKGMPVSDATSADEPQSFTPASVPINIADLPPAGTSQTPSFLRILNSRSTTNTPTPATPPTPTPSTSTWQTR